MKLSELGITSLIANTMGARPNSQTEVFVYDMGKRTLKEVRQSQANLLTATSSMAEQLIGLGRALRAVDTPFEIGTVVEAQTVGGQVFEADFQQFARGPLETGHMKFALFGLDPHQVDQRQVLPAVYGAEQVTVAIPVQDRWGRGLVPEVAGRVFLSAHNSNGIVTTMETLGANHAYLAQVDTKNQLVAAVSPYGPSGLSIYQTEPTLINYLDMIGAVKNPTGTRLVVNLQSGGEAKAGLVLGPASQLQEISAILPRDYVLPALQGMMSGDMSVATLWQPNPEIYW
jgi:hypothetical protein